MRGVITLLRQIVAEWFLNVAFRIAPNDTREGQILKQYVAWCALRLFREHPIPPQFRKKAQPPNP